MTTTGGRDKLYRQLHEQYVGISRRDVMNFLKQQESWQLRAKVVKNKVSYPIVAKQPNHIWQMDLIVFENTPDQGYKYILTIIDLFSKFLRAYPLKNKEAETIEAQLRKVFSTSKPRILQSDNGSEFANNLVVNLMKEKGIRQAFSKAYTPQSQGQIERVNQTIKGLLHRNFIQTGTKKWVNVLPLVVENLNQSIHSMTGFKPKDLNDPQLPEETLHLVLSRINKFANKETKRAPTFNIGDQVRISQYAFPENKKNTFFKPIEKWTRELYEVVKVYQPQSEEPWAQSRYLLNIGMVVGGFEIMYVNPETLVRAVVSTARAPETKKPIVQPQISLPTTAPIQTRQQAQKVKEQERLKMVEAFHIYVPIIPIGQ